MISALRGRCPRPLDECGAAGRHDTSGSRNPSTVRPDGSVGTGVAEHAEHRSRRSFHGVSGRREPGLCKALRQDAAHGRDPCGTGRLIEQVQRPLRGQARDARINANACAGSLTQKRLTLTAKTLVNDPSGKSASSIGRSVQGDRARRDPLFIASPRPIDGVGGPIDRGDRPVRQLLADGGDCRAGAPGPISRSRSSGRISMVSIAHATRAGRAVPR